MSSSTTLSSSMRSASSGDSMPSRYRSSCWSWTAIPCDGDMSRPDSGPMLIGSARSDLRRARTALHAFHQSFSDAPGTDRERIHGDAKPLGELAATLDLLLPRLGVVLDDELTLLRLQALEAAIEALETALAFDVGLGPTERPRHVGHPRFVEWHVAALAPQIFEQHEPR